MASAGVLSVPTPRTTGIYLGTTMALLTETNIERPIIYVPMTQEMGLVTLSEKPPVTDTMTQYFFFSNALLIVGCLFSLISIYLSIVLLERNYAGLILGIFLLTLSFIFPIPLTGIFTLIFASIFFQRDSLSKPTKKFLKFFFPSPHN